jgi:alkaline phosphatase
MKKIIILLCFPFFLFAQVHKYTSTNIHSHNDYASALPFFEAYANQVGVIEADVFLINNDLFVAHKLTDSTSYKTLKKQYLEPLVNKIKALNGKIYPNDKPLSLMIDVKSDAVRTLQMIVKQLNLYPEITQNKDLKIIISGNRPNPYLWKNYPTYISFDGRLDETYTTDQLARIEMISEDLKNQTPWNGKGVLTIADLEKIRTIIRKVHKQDKKIRFWSTQDNVNTWIALMNLEVDYIGTDNSSKLKEFMHGLKNNSCQNTYFHTAYIPKKQEDFSTNKKPKNIILLIGDGMGLTQIYAAYTANRGQLNILNIPVHGSSITIASDSYITDSAAAATAMATGRKTNNRFIGVDENGKALVSIVQKLRKKNFQTALISSGNSTDATPAAFYAKQPDRSYNEAIALDFLTYPTDILIGGGTNEFIDRKDGINLIKKLQDKGYTFSTNFSDMDSITSSKFIIADNDAVLSKKEGRGDFLSKAFTKTIGTFSKSKKPFFIMEEGAQIDYGGHRNELDYVIRELLDFDQLVGLAMEFVDNNKETLLIVTADHETGGLSIIDGNIEKGSVIGNFSTNDHTAVAVPVFAYGPAAEFFNGTYQNTAIFDKIDSIFLQN